MAKKKKIFDKDQLLREIARERVGPVPPGQIIRPKKDRRKPKHKPVEDEQSDNCMETTITTNKGVR